MGTKKEKGVVIGQVASEKKLPLEDTAGSVGWETKPGMAPPGPVRSDLYARPTRDTGEPRAAKLARIREQLAHGVYRVDARKVAIALIIAALHT